jgi:hypothetical protein
MKPRRRYLHNARPNRSRRKCYAAQPEEARSILRRLQGASARRYINPHFLASAHAGLGELDQAFDLWEAMVRDGAPGAFLLRTDLLFDPLRPEPRFTALLDALRFPAAGAAQMCTVGTCGGTNPRTTDEPNTSLRSRRAQRQSLCTAGRDCATTARASMPGDP